MKNKRGIVNFIINSTIAIITIIIVFVITALAVIYVKTNKNTMEIADFMGYKPIICISNSMEDEFQVGDIIINKKVPENEINIGDIITFNENGTVIMHRVKEIKYDENGNIGYITKGDSNNTIDENIVKYTDVEGKYYYMIPKIGNLILMLQKPQGFLIALFIPMAILVICYKIILSRKELKELRKSKLLKRLQEKEIANNNF